MDQHSFTSVNITIKHYRITHEVLLFSTRQVNHFETGIENFFVKIVKKKTRQKNNVTLCLNIKYYNKM